MCKSSLSEHYEQRDGLKLARNIRTFNTKKKNYFLGTMKFFISQIRLMASFFSLKRGQLNHPIYESWIGNLTTKMKT